MKACAKRAKAKFTWAFTASAAKVQAHEVGLKMKACAKRAKAKFTWTIAVSAAKVQAHEVGLKWKDKSLLTKNSPSKLGGVPQGRGSVGGFVDNRV